MKMRRLIVILLYIGLWLTSCGQPIGNDAVVSPIDLNNLEAVTAAYITPLVPTGDLFYYSWNDPSEIKPDDLIKICAFNNDLHLPQDFEGCYLPEYRYVAAEKVESAILQRFDVSADYLRTSTFYREEDRTYEMIGGFGGGCGMIATAATPKGNQILISVALSQPLLDDFNSSSALEEQTEGRSITPIGTMIIEHRPNHPVKYISYSYNS